MCVRERESAFGRARMRVRSVCRHAVRVYVGAGVTRACLVVRNNKDGTTLGNQVVSNSNFVLSNY